MLTTKRRCLRVTTVSSFCDASGGCCCQTLQKTRQTAPVNFRHAQKFDAEFVFQHPPHGRHTNGDRRCLPGYIEREGDHFTDCQRPIRHDLATSHAQVVYDSRAGTVPGEPCGHLDDVSFILAFVHRRAETDPEYAYWLNSYEFLSSMRLRVSTQFVKENRMFH